MTPGSHPITLNGGSIIDSGSLFAGPINLNGGSITNSGPLGSAGGILVNSAISAHLSAGSLTGFGSVSFPLGLSGALIAQGGTLTLTDGVSADSMTVTQTGFVDLGQNLNVATLFGGTGSNTTPGNFGTLNLNGFNLTIAGGMPLAPGFYTNPTNGTVVDVVNVPVPDGGSTLVLLGMGCVGIMVLVRRSKLHVAR
jgi:hypothetical protein